MYLTNVRLQKENRERMPSLGNSCCTHAMLDVLLATVLQNIVHLLSGFSWNQAFTEAFLSFRYQGR